MTRNPCVLLLSLLSTALVPSLVLAQEVEPPAVQCSEVPTLPIFYTQHTEGCRIDSVTDIDKLSFEGIAGDTVRIIVRSQTNGLDVRVELRDPSGVLRDTFCDGNPFPGNPVQCTVVVDILLVQSGAHTISVSDVTSNEIGDYRLQLERLPRPVPQVNLVYDVPVTGTVDPTTDLDFFSFIASADATDPDTVRITVRSMTNGFDARIELWGPDDALIGTTSCDGNPFPGNPVLCTAVLEPGSPRQQGVHKVAVSDVTSNETGVFEIAVQCLAGACLTVKLLPECAVDVAPGPYGNGDTVTVNELRVENLTRNALPLEWKTWLELPRGTVSIVNIGADGSVVVPPGTDFDFGPFNLLAPVTPQIPRGRYTFGCRLLNPTTGLSFGADVAVFEIQ